LNCILRSGSNCAHGVAQLPHALLLTGQRGIGKFELARSFAASLLCENLTAAGEACGACLACGWLAQGNHPDLRLLQPNALIAEAAESGELDEAGKKKPSQQITIDQVRALDDFLHVGTHRHGARVVLLNPAEAMNRSTANALLKSLEEPIASTLFLLISSEPHRLLPTIRSRCQVMPVRHPVHGLAGQWLRDAGVARPKTGWRWPAVRRFWRLNSATAASGCCSMRLLAQLTRGNRTRPLGRCRQPRQGGQGRKAPGSLEARARLGAEVAVRPDAGERGSATTLLSCAGALLQALAQTTDTRKLLAFTERRYNTRPSASSH
jgi:DNA polymerase-3 subunit delta'